MSQSLDDDDDFDYEDRVYAMLKAQGKFNVDAVPQFTNATAGIREALAILRGAIAMGGVPSTADVTTMCSAVLSSPDNAKHAEELLAILAEANFMEMVTSENQQALEGCSSAMAI